MSVILWILGIVVTLIIVGLLVVSSRDKGESVGEGLSQNDIKKEILKRNPKR